MAAGSESLSDLVLFHVDSLAIPERWNPTTSRPGKEDIGAAGFIWVFLKLVYFSKTTNVNQEKDNKP